MSGRILSSPSPLFVSMFLLGDHVSFYHLLSSVRLSWAVHQVTFGTRVQAISIFSSLSALEAIEKYTENITVVQSQFCFQSQLLGFPDGLQHSEGLTCLSDPSRGIFCRVSICCDFTSQVCKVLNVFQSITVVSVVYGDGVICLVAVPHQFGFCCVEL